MLSGQTKQSLEGEAIAVCGTARMVAFKVLVACLQRIGAAERAGVRKGAGRPSPKARNPRSVGRANFFTYPQPIHMSDIRNLPVQTETCYAQTTGVDKGFHCHSRRSPIRRTGLERNEAKLSPTKPFLKHKDRTVVGLAL
jgi:hypothetical protein